MVGRHAVFIWAVPCTIPWAFISTRSRVSWTIVTFRGPCLVCTINHGTDVEGISRGKVRFQEYSIGKWRAIHHKLLLFPALVWSDGTTDDIDLKARCYTLPKTSSSEYTVHPAATSLVLRPAVFVYLVCSLYTFL